MAIIKNDIPILEFDDESKEILQPLHEGANVKLPSKAVFVFMNKIVDIYAEYHKAKVVWKFVSATKLFPIYVVNYKGEDICLVQAPVGAPSSTQLMDWLIGHGVNKIISAGSVGVLKDIEESRLLIPTKALRDEGTSYHYLPASRYVELNKRMVELIKEELDQKNLSYEEVITWTTDGFYRETEDMVAYRREEGCSVVEMECAALASCAKFRNVMWGEILYAADNLSKSNSYDDREWGKSAIVEVFELCFDIISKC